MTYYAFVLRRVSFETIYWNKSLQKYIFELSFDIQKLKLLKLFQNCILFDSFFTFDNCTQRLYSVFIDDFFSSAFSGNSTLQSYLIKWWYWAWRYFSCRHVFKIILHFICSLWSKIHFWIKFFDIQIVQIISKLHFSWFIFLLYLIPLNNIFILKNSSLVPPVD